LKGGHPRSGGGAGAEIEEVGGERGFGRFEIGFALPVTIEADRAGEAVELFQQDFAVYLFQK
jgi:hypothetical protein